MSFELHGEFCPAQHVSHNRIGSLAQQFNLPRGPSTPLGAKMGMPRDSLLAAMAVVLRLKILDISSSRILPRSFNSYSVQGSR